MAAALPRALGSVWDELSSGPQLQRLERVTALLSAGFNTQSHDIGRSIRNLVDYTHPTPDALLGTPPSSVEQSYLEVVVGTATTYRGRTTTVTEAVAKKRFHRFVVRCVAGGFINGVEFHLVGGVNGIVQRLPKVCNLSFYISFQITLSSSG
jgi:hypothetical protein